MSWSKNGFSYLMWLVYTVAVGNVLIGLCTSFCARMGVAVYWGLVAAVLYTAVVGGIVFLLFRLAPRCAAFVEKKRNILPALEAGVVVSLLAVGVVLRLCGIAAVEPVSEYYDAARVVPEQQIPQLAHGASYLYLQMLNTVFLLAGNYFVAGIWVQIVLQLVAAVLMFFTVRRLAGVFPALTAYGFCMCAPYMIQYSLSLSPEPLYFGILSLAALLLSAGGEGGLKPVRFLFAGVLAAVCAYFDIMGILLLFLMGAFLFCRRVEEADVRRKLFSFIFCVIGVVVGFLCCVFLDSLMSGKTVQGVLGAWLALYSPGKFRLPVSVGGTGSVTENFILPGLLVMGIFSFWCDRQKECISLWVTAAGCVMLAGCYGVFTEVMPGFYYLYLLCSVLAGIGLQQCFYTGPVGNAVTAVEEQKLGERKMDDLKVEDLDRANVGSGEREEEIRQENALKEEFRQEREKTEQENTVRENVLQLQEPDVKEEKKTQYIENPLPLPKKHVKRVMDYPLQDIPEDDDFDHPVREDDDFDI